MCLNCGYSLDDRPNECLECDICSRNPSVVTRKFIPVKYKGNLILKPVDMFISQERRRLLEKEIRKTYEEGMKAGTKLALPSWDERVYLWQRAKFPYSQSLMAKTSFKVDNIGFSWGQTNDTLTITWTINLSEDDLIDTNKLEIAEEIGEIKEDRKVEKGKIVCINIVDILEGLDGVEVEAY